MTRLAACKDGHHHIWVWHDMPGVFCCKVCAEQRQLDGAPYTPPEPRSAHWTDREKATGPSFLRRY